LRRIKMIIRKSYKSTPFLLSLISILTLVMVLPGCSEGDIDLDDSIRRALTASQNVHNYEADIQIDMTLTIGEKTMDFPGTVNISAFIDPLKVKMLSTTGVPPSTVSTESYATKEEDTLTTYKKIQDKWSQQETIHDSDAPSPYDQAALIEHYLRNVENIQFVSTEQINGTKTHRITGTLRGLSLAHAVNAGIKAADLPPDLLPESDSIISLADELVSVPIDIWIDKDTFYPVQYRIDMTGAISQACSAQPSSSSVAISIDKAIVVVTLKNINQAIAFDIPEEAMQEQP
jgi:hypothetical protein